MIEIHIQHLLMSNNHQGLETDGLSLAYCIRYCLWSQWNQFIQDGAQYSQSRDDIQRICTDHVANRFMAQDSAQFLNFIRDNSLADAAWHSRLIDLIRDKFVWESSIFYDGDLEHANEYDRQCRRQLLQFALEHGADPGLQPNTDLIGPLLCQSSSTYSGQCHGDIQSILLLYGYDVDIICISTGMTCLQISSGRCHIQIIHDLILAGANPNYIGHTSGLTPLHHTANYIHDNAIHAVHILVDGGADPNSIDHDLLTPMHFAATRDNIQVVQALCDRGANLYGTSVSNPWSPAFFAIINQSNRVLRLLLDRGHSPNHTGPGRRSLLHAAVECHNHIAIEMLLESGANIDDIDEYGMSALGSCIYTLDIQALHILVRFHAEISSHILHTAARISNQSIMALLIQSYEHDPDITDMMGKTALMYAARSGNSDTVNALVDAHVDINKHDRSGFTALFYARAYGNYQVESILLAAGATHEQIKSRLVPFCGRTGPRRIRSAVY